MSEEQTTPPLAESDLQPQETVSTGFVSIELRGPRVRLRHRLGKLIGRAPSTEVEVRTSFDNPDIDFIASHADDYIDWVGKKSVATPQQQTSAAEIVEATSPTELWPQLGFKPRDFGDSELHQSFVKENDPSQAHLTGSKFWIKKDEDGREKLLKVAGDNSVRHGERDFGALFSAQSSEAEVMAYRVAKLIGYPVPETELAGWNGLPFITYEFVPEAVDLERYYDESPQDLATISNPDESSLRPLFNFLVGSFGDTSHQAFIDQQTGRYYANDLGMTAKPPSVLHNGNIELLKDWKAYFNYAQANPDEAEKSYGAVLGPLSNHAFRRLVPMIETLRRLDFEAAKKLLNPGTPMIRDKEDDYAAGLAERAGIIVSLYDGGFFRQAA